MSIEFFLLFPVIFSSLLRKVSTLNSLAEDPEKVFRTLVCIRHEITRVMPDYQFQEMNCFIEGGIILYNRHNAGQEDKDKELLRNCQSCGNELQL
jgi:hypothetical protein